MKHKTTDNSVIIIGAGFAGLAAGIYARINGYNTQIFEMHDQPGGLCTSWKRKGYTLDGCVHWLVGSSPKSGMHDFWEETGISQGREFIDLDEYMRLEDLTGRTLIFYTNVDRLEKHLLEFSPQDEKPIREFTNGIRLCFPFDFPSKHDPTFTRLKRQIKTIFSFIRKGKKIQDWMKITAEDFSQRFKDPLLTEAFKEIWIPEFSMFFILFTFAYLHNKNAGYPIGGSKPMSQALESKYKEMGGIVHYKSKVKKIITTGDNAAGITLEDGTSHMAARIISAADGHSTIFSMLDEKYISEKTREPFEKWPLFPSLIYVSLGVNRTFDDIPLTVSGITFHLEKPVEIGDIVRDKLSVHIFNQDPTMAPAGKTVITLMLETDYEYWKKLAQDRTIYLNKKEEVGLTIVELLNQRFPGISSLVDIIDVATPLTYERFTGNWKGSFEGWLITPDNARVLMKPMPQSLPQLKNFYMCGQWVEPGGGLPTAIMSGRKLIKKLCREDHRKFRSE
jgi:phytoene dehydrogenase-like protein